jgi:TolB protein
MTVSGRLMLAVVTAAAAAPLHGALILFQRGPDEPFGDRIWTMASNGSGARPLQFAGLGYNANPTWSPDGTRIAYDAYPDGDYDVYVMNADGSHVRNLTNHPALDASPAWSPDGKKIAFVSDRARKGHREIYVMNADGSHVVRLTHTPGNLWSTQPDWQP